MFERSRCDQMVRAMAKILNMASGEHVAYFKFRCREIDCQRRKVARWMSDGRWVTMYSIYMYVLFYSIKLKQSNRRLLTFEIEIGRTSLACITNYEIIFRMLNVNIGHFYLSHISIESILHFHFVVWIRNSEQNFDFFLSFFFLISLNFSAIKKNRSCGINKSILEFFSSLPKIPCVILKHSCHSKKHKQIRFGLKNELGFYIFSFLGFSLSTCRERIVHIVDVVVVVVVESRYKPGMYASKVSSLWVVAVVCVCVWGVTENCVVEWTRTDIDYTHTYLYFYHRWNECQRDI